MPRNLNNQFDRIKVITIFRSFSISLIMQEVPTFQHAEAFQAIIDVADDYGYLHVQYLKLDVMEGAFRRLIEGSIRDGTTVSEATTKVIDMILPALIMVDKTTDHEFDLEVRTILEYYGYPIDNENFDQAPKQVDPDSE